MRPTQTFSVGALVGMLGVSPLAIWYYQGIQDYAQSVRALHAAIELEETTNCLEFKTDKLESRAVLATQIALMRGQISPWGDEANEP
jgi:hypothetical protein